MRIGNLTLLSRLPTDATRLERVTWLVAVPAIVVGTVTLGVGIAVDSPVAYVTGVCALLAAYVAVTVIQLRGIERARRRAVADAAVALARRREYWERRRRAIRELSDRVFSADDPVPSDVRRLGELLDAAWNDTDETEETR